MTKTTHIKKVTPKKTAATDRKEGPVGCPPLAGT